jgi:hypothetical protein
VILLLAAVLAAAQLSAPVQQTYAQGETLDYNLAWMRVTGGTARMTIAPSGDDRFRITSVAKSSPGFSRIFKVRDEIETFVARSDFSTLRYVKRLNEEDDSIEEVTVVEDGVATRTRKKVKKVDVPRPVFDPMSVIFFLRMQTLAPGETHELELIADGKRYDVHARVVRRETISTPAGRFATVVVEPQMSSGGVARDERLFIWYSDDWRHLPVRIRTEVKFGAITANLTAVRGGVQSIEPPALRSEKVK